MINRKINILKRGRIEEELKYALNYPIIFICAGAGYGKTIAVRNFLNDYDDSSKIIWFTISDYKMDSSYLMECFYNIIEDNLNCTCNRLGFGENIIKKLKENNYKNIILVIDDWNLNNSERFDFIIKKICSTEIDNFHTIIISRKSPNSEFEVNENCFVLKQNILEFSRSEINELFLNNNLKLSEEQIDRIYNYSEGWSTVVYLLLIEYIQYNNLDSLTGVENLVKSLVYDMFYEDEKKAILKLSLLDSFTVEQAEYITENRNIPKVIKNLCKNYCFVNYNKSQDTYKLHNILKTALNDEIYFSEINPKDLYDRCAEWFYNNKDYISAIEKYYQSENYSKIYQIMENINSVELLNVIPEIIGKAFINMTKDKKLEFPSAYISYILSYIFCVNLYKGKELLSEAKEFFKENSKNNKIIFAEMNLVDALLGYFDFVKFSNHIKMAYNLFEGRKSKVVKGDMTLSFGVPCTLYLYHKNIGKMKELCDKFKDIVSLFCKMTNGCGLGTEYIINAEYAIETGDYKLARIMAEKAIYKAQYKNESKNIFAESYGVGIRLEIIEANFEKAIELLNKMKLMLSSCNNLSLISQIEMSIGYGWGILGQLDKMPDWIVNYDMTKSKALFQGREACFIMFGIAMILKKDFYKLEVHSEVMEERSKENRNIYRLIYSFIFSAITNVNFSDNNKAEYFLLKAVELAQPDNIKLPFIELSPHYINLIKKVSSSNIHIKNILNDCIKYTSNYNKLNQIKENNNLLLTHRETEVMNMLCNSYKQIEIAEELCISITTVKTHVKNIYNKLGAYNKKEAIIFWNQIKIDYNNK